MKPLQYCYEKIAAQGSPIYYSLKKVISEKRDGLVVLTAFYEELMQVVFNYSDVNIAYQQLSWWRGEVIKIPQKLASHPVSIAMQSVMFEPQALFDMIDGVEQILAPTIFETFEDVVIHIMRTGGARELLVMDLLTTREKLSSEIIYQIALVIELVKTIQSLRSYIRRGLIMFPRDELQKFNVSPELFSTFKTTPAIRNLLNHQAGKIEQYYKKIIESLAANKTMCVKYLLTRCDIAMATLREIQKSDFNVLENFIELTPLKMWWIAYRSC